MASVDTALLLLCGNLKTSDHGLRSALQSTTKRLYVYFAGEAQKSLKRVYKEGIAGLSFQL